MTTVWLTGVPGRDGEVGAIGLPGPKGLRGYPGLDGAAGQKGDCVVPMQRDSSRLANILKCIEIKISAWF